MFFAVYNTIYVIKIDISYQPSPLGSMKSMGFVELLGPLGSLRSGALEFLGYLGFIGSLGPWGAMESMRSLGSLEFLGPCCLDGSLGSQRSSGPSYNIFRS